MARGEEFDAILTRGTDGGDISSEAPCGEILAEGLVDLAQSRGQGSPEVKAYAGIRAAYGGQQRGADAMTRDVGQNDSEPSV